MCLSTCHLVFQFVIFPFLFPCLFLYFQTNIPAFFLFSPIPYLPTYPYPQNIYLFATFWAWTVFFCFFVCFCQFPLHLFRALVLAVFFFLCMDKDLGWWRKMNPYESNGKGTNYRFTYNIKCKIILQQYVGTAIFLKIPKMATVHSHNYLILKCTC